MKKIVLMLTAIFMSIGAFAQFQAGNILLNGILDFSGDQSKESANGTTVAGPKTITFEIGPSLEFFLTNKISLGGGIDYTNTKTVDENPGGGIDETRSKSNLTTIAPFASFYFINEEKFALFCKLGMGFGFGKDKYERITGATTVTTETNVSTFDVGIKPGVAVHLSEKFGMNATFGLLGYSSTKYDYGNSVTTDSKYGLKITPSLGFGIFYKLK